jgi:hypothetical protein
VASDYSVGGEPNWVAAGDFNFDGIQDVAVTTWRSGEVFVFLGSADDRLRPMGQYGIGAYTGWVAIGDFNRDGLDDLVVTHHEGVAILLNGGQR